MYVRAQSANSSASGDVMEASIAKGRKALVESVPLKIGEDVGFGEVGALMPALPQ